MIPALLAILSCQLAGEAIARTLSLPLPGPVLGMVLMVLALVVSPRLAALVQPVAQGILSHMSLLFVPAGAGVVGHIATLGADGVPVFLALLGSTVLAIAAGALTFAGVARLIGSRDDD
ncbi:MAG: CidA/LrgA family protein [Rhodobacteraceae bacterium]|nr:CidA/LrgA family protein [Paracoccaceae bacterium]